MTPKAINFLMETRGLWWELYDTQGRLWTLIQGENFNQALTYFVNYLKARGIEQPDITASDQERDIRKAQKQQKRERTKKQRPLAYPRRVPKLKYGGLRPIYDATERTTETRFVVCVSCGGLIKAPEKKPAVRCPGCGHVN